MNFALENVNSLHCSVKMTLKLNWVVVVVWNSITSEWLIHIQKCNKMQIVHIKIEKLPFISTKLFKTWWSIFNLLGKLSDRSLSSSLLNICARFSNFFFENLLSPRVIRLYRLRTFLFPVLMIRISILYVYFFSEFCCWYSWFFPKFAKFAKKPCWWHWFENTPYCRVNFCPLNRAINLKFPIYFRFCP